MILFKRKALMSFLLVCLEIGLAISGCTPHLTPVPITSAPAGNSASSPSDTPAPSKLPATVTPTSTAPAPTTSEPPLPSQTGTLSAQGEKKDCLNVLPALLGDEAVPGTLIVYRQGSKYSRHRPGTGEEKEILGKAISFTVSPDGTYYAYMSLDPSRLMIVSADGQVQKSLAWKEDWKGLARWLDNQRLLIEIKPVAGSPSASNQDYPQTFLVFNPFTGEKKKLLPDFPEIDTTNYMDWDNSGITAYDPSLTRVVYPKVSGGSQELILWNIPEKKQIASFPFEPSIPKWTQDGNNFFLVGDNGFEEVTRDGAATEISGFVLSVDYYSISPDNRYLAIWTESYPPDQDALTLLDTANHQILNTCIPAGFDPMHVYPLPLPAWSPDGKYLAVQANYRAVDNSSDLVLIDVDKKVAVKIGSNAAPIGWLK